MVEDARPTDSSIDHFWQDPAPGIQGVLLSDAISYYIDTAKLIEDWEPSSIKPASYGLRLGSRYYCDGRFGDLKEGEKLILPSNSLTYVSMLEKLNIPLYMIARFNLKIDLIYHGIILGTGPQVDPGFRGNLSCPLHNISNNPVEIKYGDRFATIDFIKTSKFPSPGALPELQGLTTETLYRRYSKEGVPGYQGKKVVLFPAEKLERKVLNNYLPSGVSLVSSLKEFEQTIKLTKNINIGVGITLIGFLLTLAIGGTALWWNQFEYFRTLCDNLDQQITRNTVLTERNDHLQQKLQELETKIDLLESKMVTSPKKVAPRTKPFTSQGSKQQPPPGVSN